MIQEPEHRHPPTVRHMNLILKAAAFARQAHADQRRKYNDRPYIQHPARVAGRVAAHPQVTEAMVAAAFLHDVVEDTPHTLDEVSAEFGPEVARLVLERIALPVKYRINPTSPSIRPISRTMNI